MDPPNATIQPHPGVPGFNPIHFIEEIHHLITMPPENNNSFTALLELPPNRAVELLHSPDSFLVTRPDPIPFHQPNLTFPTNTGLIERASRFSVFAAATAINSTETSSVPSNSSANLEIVVKSEPGETESLVNSSQPLLSDPMVENRGALKRKEREKKVKGSSKKSKSAAKGCSEDSEKLPYVHVRARRGQATDNHSLAERARREKINARMKLLQELVPGCSKISGTALILDEIINHVQSLQRQVELLSMKLAAVNSRFDFNLDSVLSAESGCLPDGEFPNMVMSQMLPEGQANGNQLPYQQEWQSNVLHQPVWGREECSPSFVTHENSFLSYGSSANSASLQLNQLKMEL